MLNKNEHVYLDALRNVLLLGEDLPDRTGTGRTTLFGVTMGFDLQEGFPLMTTKKTWFKGIATELLWFLKGRTDIEFLHDHGVHFWDEWVKEDGTFGPVYGKQLRDCNGVDQFANVVESLRSNPFSRRHVISLWHPPELEEMALPPCHGVAIQFYTNGALLDCQMYQRSADMFLGVPFNIASYALLTEIVGNLTDLQPNKLKIVLGDAHIYSNHFEQVREQLLRKPKHPPACTVASNYCNWSMDVDTAIDKLKLEDIRLTGYSHHPAIKAPIAV